jgi:hypothetical protein
MLPYHLRDLQRQVPEGLEGKAAGGAFPGTRCCKMGKPWEKR